MNQDSPPPKSDLAEKLTDGFIKLLVTGGGGSALYFLFVDELPKAAIAGAVAGAIAFGTGLFNSYSKRFEQTLQEKAAVQAEKDASVLADSISYIRERIWLRLSGFRNQYLQCLKTNCAAIEIEGFENLPTLDLAKVFVPLRTESERDPFGAASSKTSKQIWDFLPGRSRSAGNNPYRKLLIVAGPGYGKTTLLRHLALMYITSGYRQFQVSQLLPVPLRLRDVYRQIQNERQPDLPALIAGHIHNSPEFPGLKPNQLWFSQQLQRGRCLVMLDGLDEVAEGQRQTVRQWANWQMKAYPQNQFILTSRPHGIEPQPDESEFVSVEASRLKIIPFNPDQKERFVRQWYLTYKDAQWSSLWRQNQVKPRDQRLSRKLLADKIRKDAAIAASDLLRELTSNPALNDLARNPLLITLIVRNYQADLVLAERREDLYKQMCNLLLGRRPQKKETRLTLRAPDNQTVLQVLALELMHQDSTRFAPATGAAWIADRLAQCSQETSLTPEKFLKEIHDIAGLFAGEEGEQYEFVHKTFQEYLAALEIKAQGQETVLFEKFHNPNWAETIRFYAALVADATPSIEAALENPTADALTLAYRIVQDGSKVDAAVRDRLEKAIVDAERHAQTAARPAGSSDTSSRAETVVETESQSSDLAAAVRLNQRFRQLTPINEQTALDPTGITWGEYQLFLEDQATGQFHSQAEPIGIPAGQENQYAIGISWQDARWFCAWLATQANLQPEEGAYFYHLPTEVEVQQVASAGNWIPFTDSQQKQGDVLQVVRMQLSDRYKALLNYLANGRWKEADKETDRVMLEVTGQTDRGYLLVEDIEKFPCEDLRTINQLWVNFSGGRFGFSVQRDIYVDVGGQLDGQYNKGDFEKFSDRVKWRVGGYYLDFDQLTYDLTGAPGHLPAVGHLRGAVGWLSSLVQRLVNCSI